MSRNTSTNRSATNTAYPIKNLLSDFSLSVDNHNTINFTQNITNFNGYQYVVFYAARGAVMVAKAPIGSSKWIYFNTGLNTSDLSNSHLVASIGIDSDGYIHIVYDVHGTALKYIKSNLPEDPGYFVTASMTGSDETSVTYPRFFRANGVLFFSYRDGSSSLGHQHLNKYNTSTQTWTALHHKFIDGGTDDSVYSDNFVVDNSGKIHHTFMWRTTNTPPILSDYTHIYSEDNGTTWKQTDGTAQTIPVTISNNAPFLAGSVDQLVNQHNGDVDGDGHPHIVYWKNAVNGHINYYHTWYDGSAWQTVQITNYTDTPTQIDLNVEKDISRARILINRNTNKAYVFTRPYMNGAIKLFTSSPPYTTFTETDFSTDTEWGYMEFGGVDKDQWDSTNILHLVATPSISNPGRLYVLSADLESPIVSGRELAGYRQKIRDFGTCLKFKQSGDLIGPMNFTQGDTYTICFWANFNSLGASSAGRIFDGINNVFQLTGTNQITINHNGSTKVSSNNIIVLKSWRFYCISYDGANIRFYRDGKRVGTILSQTTKPSTSSVSYTFFNRSDGARYVDGLVDDFRYYKNRVLSEEEIQKLYYGYEPATTGLSIHWKFDEGSGTTITDSSGIGNNTTVTGATYSTNVFMKTRTAA